MWDAGNVDDVAWGALTLTLTVLGGLYTWFAFRRRGLASGLRGASFTLVPIALYLTHTLRLVTDVAGDVADWAVHLVFSPAVWLGFGVAGLAAVLYVVSGHLRDREARSKPSPTGAQQAPAPGQLPEGRRARNRSVVEDDPELAEIEALLRKRGIS
jgi:hypothetical protein